MYLLHYHNHKIFNRSTQAGAGVSIFFKFFALLKRVESCTDSNKIITILFAALLAVFSGFYPFVFNNQPYN